MAPRAIPVLAPPERRGWDEDEVGVAVAVAVKVEKIVAVAGKGVWTLKVAL